MTVQVKLFGMLKSLADNRAAVDVTLSEGRQVEDLVDEFQAAYPQIGTLLIQKKVLVSVNHEIAQPDTPLSPTDEIALLPPFAGGADEPRRNKYVHC